MWGDHGKTESPNAVWTMGAMSGLLDVSLEKPGHYHLGEGFRDTLPDDIRLAVRVGYGAAVLGVAVAIGMLMARHALVG